VQRSATRVGFISVTHLRQIMLEELQRRNFAKSTINIYIRTVEQFCPTVLGESRCASKSAW